MRGFVARFQKRHERPRQPHHRPEIDLEQPFEIAFADLVEGAAERNACIVEQQCDLARFAIRELGEAGRRGARQFTAAVMTEQTEEVLRKAVHAA